MRRVLQLAGLSGLVMTGFVSMRAFAEEPSDAEQPTCKNKRLNSRPPRRPSLPAAAVVAPAAKPKVGDISTHGYFRGGFGANVEPKGPHDLFRARHDKWKFEVQVQAWQRV
jgi:hypothetical protein